VTTTTTNYLRIHRDPERLDTTSPIGAADRSHDFWQAFSEATGWRVQRNQTRGEAACVLLPPADFGSTAGVDEFAALPSVARSGALKLATLADELTRELEDTRAALRRQEAELSSRAVVIDSCQEREALATELQQTLAAAARGCQCNAAAMYLLDDDTECLKTRAVSGLPESRLGQPPRPLRGSRGDLEALVQGAVTINDLEQTDLDTWNCPERAGGAICAAINNHGVPIGTLWLFSNQPRDFTPAHETIANMASSQLALLLERATVQRKHADRRSTSLVIRDLAQWQYMSLPSGTKLADNWLVDGMIESPSDWAVGWHTWDVLPDGSLMLAIAEAEDATLSGAMTAATCRAALTAHTGYQHTPTQLMQRVSDTLWQTNTGEQLLSLLYARIDPETGEGEVASAGRITAMISSRYGYRPLIDGKTPPLTSHIDARCKSSTFRLQRGEALLGYGAGIGSDGVTQMMLGDHLRTCLQRGDSHPLAAIRRSLAEIPLQQERGAISIVRQ
jgi:GAF domain-containing protein